MRPDTPPRCPDCGVSTEEMEPRSNGGYGLRFTSDESREGIMGTLGMNQSYDATAYVCPECGLSRLYAEVDD